MKMNRNQQIEAIIELMPGNLKETTRLFFDEIMRDLAQTEKALTLKVQPYGMDIEEYLNDAFGEKNVGRVEEDHIPRWEIALDTIDSESMEFLRRLPWHFIFQLEGGMIIVRYRSKFTKDQHLEGVVRDIYAADGDSHAAGVLRAFVEGELLNFWTWLSSTYPGAYLGELMGDMVKKYHDS